MLIVTRLFSKFLVFMMFLRNTGVFKFLRFEERFEKALFSARMVQPRSQDLKPG